MSARGHERASINYKDDWETPDFLFYKLHERFRFTLDAAADEKNRKVERYLTGPHIKENCRCGLCTPWHDEVVWLNPPYGKTMPLTLWTNKIQLEHAAPTVALLPNNTETKWFWDVWNSADQILLLKGRVPFEGREDGKASQNSGGNCIPIWYHDWTSTIGDPEILLWDWKNDPLPIQVGTVNWKKLNT